MPHQVEYNGQIHELPDEATPEMIAGALGVKYSPSESTGSSKSFLPDWLTRSFPNPGKFGQPGSFVSPKNVEGEINASAFGGSPIKEIGKETVSHLPFLMNQARKLGSKALEFGEKRLENYPLLKQYIHDVNPINLVRTIQSGADKLRQSSSDIYDLVKSRVLPEGVSKIKVDPKLFEEAENHLAKTDANKKLIEKAMSGDYDALHQLQSDLGSAGSEALGEETYAARNKGLEILDTRRKINESIRDQFKDYGKDYLAKLLDEAAEKYKKMHDVYYSHPTIAKMVNPKTRIVPKNPITALEEESERTKLLHETHPELKQAAEKAKTFGKAYKLSTKAGGYLLLEEMLRHNLNR